MMFKFLHAKIRNRGFRIEQCFFISLVDMTVFLTLIKLFNKKCTRTKLVFHLGSFGTEYDLIYQIVLLNNNFEKWKLQKRSF